MTTDSDPAIETYQPQGFAELETVDEQRPAHWFKAGDPRTIEAARKGGRPRKGESAQDKLVAQVSRDADKIVAAMSKAAQTGNTRAFVALWDRAFGVPKQTLVVSREDDPLELLLTRLATARGGVDASVSRDVPALPPGGDVSKQIIDQP